MTRTLCLVAAGSIAAASAAAVAIRPPATVPEFHGTFQGTGDWSLLWDDHVDHDLTGAQKVCTVELTGAGPALAGRFIGLVAGTERDAALTGTTVTGRGVELVTLRQEEAAYTVLYQARRVSAERWEGVWYDTRGGTGDFALAR